MNEGLTVKDLCAYCVDLIEKGYGDKHVCISDDDEGNGYHTLFYGFNYTKKDIDLILNKEYGASLHDNNDKDTIVLLG